MTVMMKCGHAANAVMDDGKPVCAICYGLDPGAVIIDENPPDLTGRMARCTYYGRTFRRGHCECSICRKQPDNICRCEKPSSTKLAFFSAHPE